MTTSSPATRTLPIIDNLMRPYWSAAAQGQLVAPRCRATGRFLWPPQGLALSDESSIDWVPLQGTGTVWSFSVVHRSSYPAPAVPYVLAIIELAEGLCMTSNVVNVDPSSVHIGMAVRVRMEPLGADLSLPTFEPLIKSNDRA